MIEYIENFTIEWEKVNDAYVECIVYEAIGKITDDDGKELDPTDREYSLKDATGMETTEKISEAQEYLEIAFKFDGTMHMHFGDNGYICEEIESISQQFDLIKHLCKKAKTIIKIGL